MSISQTIKGATAVAEAVSLEPSVEKGYAALKSEHSNSVSSHDTGSSGGGRIGAIAGNAERVSTAATQLQQAAAKQNASPVTREVNKHLKSHTP